MVTTTNYITFYAKNKKLWSPNIVFTQKDRDKRYNNWIENYLEPYQRWRLGTVSDAFCASLEVPEELKLNSISKGKLKKLFSGIDEQERSELLRSYVLSIAEAKKALGKEEYDRQLDRFVLNNHFRIVQPVSPDYNSVGQETKDIIDKSIQEPDELHLQQREGYDDIYVRDGKRWLFYTSKLKDIDGKMVSGEPLTNLWDDLLSNNLHNEGGVKFPKGKKPENLLKRCLDVFSNPGDLVLDSFLGSGTTAAVAHKMGRRWIGVEMGEHAITHCVPRLRKVIDGEQGGVSKAINWKGGGAFRFYKLGEPVFDADGRIRDGLSFSVLAAHVWFSETHTPLPEQMGKPSPFLGVYTDRNEQRGLALLYNGILGDKSISGGNVLTSKTLRVIRAASGDFEGPLTVYGERSAFGHATLERENIIFRQTPYDVAAVRRS